MIVFEAWGCEEYIEVDGRKSGGQASAMSSPEGMQNMFDAGLCEPEERPLWSIRCATWEEAMQFYHDFNDYGPYIPMVNDP